MDSYSVTAVKRGRGPGCGERRGARRSCCEARGRTSTSLSARRIELRTVEWSRPPKSRPIWGRERSVISRVRRIATWRARSGVAARPGADQLGARRGRRRPPTAAWISSTAGAPAALRGGGEDLAISSELSGLAISEACAITRVRAPWSWRTLASIRAASSSQGVAVADLDPGLADEAAQDRRAGWRGWGGRRRGSGPTRSGRGGARRGSRARSGCGRPRGRVWLPAS